MLNFERSMRAGPIVACLMSSLGWATTLQLLSTDQMIRQSTAVVRVKVAGSTATLRGRNIYTVYQLTVLETLKNGPDTSSVAIPGGTAGAIRQMVAGAPTLIAGQEYVIFLWTSRTGLTQIIGLSQGLFSVGQDASGNAVLTRPAAAGVVVNPGGAPVPASAVTMTLAALRSEIQKVLQ